LRGEDHVGDDDPEHEREEQALERLLERLRAAPEDDVVGLGHGVLDEAVDLRDRVGL
jgi:hypothetical protein